MKTSSKILIFAFCLALLNGLVQGAEKNAPPQSWPALAIYEIRVNQAGLTPEDLDVHSIGQSHIDAAWRWRLKQTHTKVYRTWGQAIEQPFAVDTVAGAVCGAKAEFGVVAGDGRIVEL